MSSDFDNGVSLGVIVGLLSAFLVFIIFSATYPTPSAPSIYTGNVAVAPTAAPSGSSESILITLSNHPNTVINCKVDLSADSGKAQAYSLMTLTVGQHISVMQYNGNCTLFG